MAAESDFFVFGDDFEAILDLLEADENIEREFLEAAEEVQKASVQCVLCDKKCKSKLGLKRHIAIKHPEEVDREIKEYSSKHGEETTINKSITTDMLVAMVDDAKLKLSNNLVFNETLREELKAYSFKKPTEESVEFGLLKVIYDGLIKNGNPEIFYSKYYAQVPLNAMKYFPGLSRNAATLLSTKLADRMLSCSKERDNDQTKVEKLCLSDKELAGIQYLGGYVLHNLYKKLTNSKNNKLSEYQQAMSLLKAGKLEHNSDGKSTQTLITSLDCGGLWAISADAQHIFIKAEHYFRAFTSKADSRNINITTIVHSSVHDEEVISSFNSLTSSSELVTEDSVGKDVLNSIVNLYVKVRLTMM